MKYFIDIIFPSWNEQFFEFEEINILNNQNLNLDSINKKIKKLRKKLNQIMKLEEKLEKVFNFFL